MATDIDLATVASGLVSLLLGDGDGTFGPKTDYCVTSSDHSLAFGDLDGDGLDDVVVAGSVTSVLFGQSDGTVSGPTEYEAESYYVAVGDLNGDGGLDIATNAAQTLLNRGDGTFDIVDGNAEDYAFVFALGELTGDGILDRALLIGDSPVVGIAPGNGDGTFGEAGIYGLPDYPYSVAIGDLDGDGWNDLALESDTKFPNLVFHRPDRDFAAGSYHGNPMFPQDLNGDGILDVVTMYTNGNVGSYGAVMVGQSDGTYETTVVRSGDQGLSNLGIGEVNGDGNVDLIINDWWNEQADSGADGFIVLSGNGDGAFPVSTEFAQSAYLDDPAYGDLSGDRLLDIVWVGEGGDEGIFLAVGLGDGTFADPVLVFSGQWPRKVEVGDVDADGKLDLVVADYWADLVSVLRGHGDGTFAERVDLATTSSPISSLIGDLNSDTIPDLAVTFDTEPKVAVAIGQGDGSFAAWTEYPTEGVADDLKAGDMDGDGWSDLILQKEGVFTVLFNDGDGTFTKQLTYLGFGISAAEILDEDGDGRLDFVMAVEDQESIGLSVLRNTCR